MKKYIITTSDKDRTIEATADNEDRALRICESAFSRGMSVKSFIIDGGEKQVELMKLDNLEAIRAGLTAKPKKVKKEEASNEE